MSGSEGGALGVRGGAFGVRPGWVGPCECQGVRWALGSETRWLGVRTEL